MRLRVRKLAQNECPSQPRRWAVHDSRLTGPLDHGYFWAFGGWHGAMNFALWKANR